MKMCPECGRWNDDSDSFCPGCGRMLPETPDVPSVEYHPVPVRKGPSIGVAVAAIAIAAIVLGVGISYIDMNGGTSDFSDRTITYRWDYPKFTTHTVTLDISAKEMKEADSSGIDRSGSSTDVSDHAKGIYAVREYVVVSDTIRDLAQKLWEAYGDVPGTHSAKDFSEFVLMFVQIVIAYEYDSDKFGENEYWQFPVETLYRGYGDCEDTSILSAAIYDAMKDIDGAKDYILDSSVLLLPGHAMVGVRLNGTVTGSDIFSIDVGGTTHYLGETTYDDPTAIYDKSRNHIGYIGPSYYGSGIYAFTGNVTGYV